MPSIDKKFVIIWLISCIPPKTKDYSLSHNPKTTFYLNKFEWVSISNNNKTNLSFSILYIKTKSGNMWQS